MLTPVPIKLFKLLHIVVISVLVAGLATSIAPPSAAEAGGADAGLDRSTANQSAPPRNVLGEELVDGLPDGSRVYQQEEAAPAVPGGLVIPPNAPAVRDRQFQTRVAGPWLDTLNAHRALANVPAVTDNDALTDGQIKHSKYIVKNNRLTHPENLPDTTWKTPEGEAAGLNGNLAANSSVNWPDSSFIDFLMVAPFHGVGFIDPKLAVSAFGAYHENLEPTVAGRLRSAVTVDVLRGRSATGLTGTQSALWPANGKTLPLLNYPGGESPDPLTGRCSGYVAPTGPPLYLMLAVVPSVTSVTLTRDGTALDACYFSEVDYTNADGATQALGRSVLQSRHAVVVMPKAPFAPGTNYRLEIVSNGQTFVTAFTTAGGDRQPVFVGKVSTTSGSGVRDATVAACNRDANGNPVQPCVSVKSAADGTYSIAGLTPAKYHLQATPNKESTLAQSGATLVDTALGQFAEVNFVLPALQPPPADTTVTTTRPASGGIPVQDWRSTTPIQTTATAGCQVTWRLEQAGTLINSGLMTEGPAGTYKATIPALFPAHGSMQIRFAIVCNGNTQPIKEGGSIFIDPSGFVRDTAGNPIAGATVILFRSDAAAGPFTQVANGDGAIMSPSNTKNPDLTDTNGKFGWDVIAGFYKVRAQKSGCTAPGSSTSFVETEVLTIPPPVTDLDLRLNCPPPDPCNPRPNITIGVLPSGANKQITITAGRGSLTSIRFNTNPPRVVSSAWRVTATEGTFSGTTLNLPANRTQTNVILTRTGTGNVTVVFTAVDSCGDWPTFVGAGASTWTSSASSSSLPDPTDVTGGRVLTSSGPIPPIAPVVP